MVAYAITANSGASGTYPPRALPFERSKSVAAHSPGAGEHAVTTVDSRRETGYPTTAQNLGGCVTYSNSILSVSTGTGGTNYYTLPGIPYPMLIGNLYFSIVGVTNSTG